MKQKILNTWNSRDDKVVVKYLNDKDKRTVVKFPVDWFFAVKREDIVKIKMLLGQTGFKVSIADNPKFPEYTKIYCNEKNRYELVLFLEEKGISTFEGDLMPDKRWFIDKEIEIDTRHRKLYFDIETDDTIQKIEIGRDRILSFSAVDQSGKIYFEVLESLTDIKEKEFLLKVLKIISKYDIILGWNSSGFDIPYLRIRMRKYQLHKDPNYKWMEIAKYDLLKRFRHIFRFDSHLRTFALDFISRHFLGKGKIPHTEKIIELWKNDKEKLKAYNIEDSLLVKELDEKLGVSDMMIRQSLWCGVPPSQFGLYSIIDSYILKAAHRIGKYVKTSLPAIKERDYNNTRGAENPGDAKKDKAKYMGAIVLDPKVGKYDKVYTFDFKGLYPSMMRTSNIGYDTLLFDHEEGCITNPGTHHMKRKSGEYTPTYFRKEKSIINLAISDLVTKRSEYKKLKLKMIEEGTNKGPEWERVVSDEIIVKEIANSTYGIMGLEYGRYFSVDVAESITLFGQWIILYAKENFEKRGYNVIYGDTDSVFVSTGKGSLDIEEELKIFHENLKRDLKEIYNIDEVFIELAFDKQYESFILIAKKTYVGHVVNIEGKKTDDIYARGLDFIKKNTFSFAAKKQEELIDKLLLENIDLPTTTKWMDSVKKEFYGKDFSVEDLRITQKVGKKLNEYSGNPPLHVRLAQQIEDTTGQDLLGTEIEYVVTGQEPILQGVTVENYKGEYDKDYYWENKTFPVLERVAEVVYPGVNFNEINLTLF